MVGTSALVAPVTQEDAANTRPADLRRLAHGSSLSLAGSLVAAAVHLLLPVIITRRLDSDEAGAFFSLTALFAILVNVGTVGADTGVLWSLPRAKALERRGDVPTLLRISLLPVALFSIVVAGVGVLLAPHIAALVAGDSTAQRETLVTALYVSAPFLPIAATYFVVASASRGLGSIKPLVLIEKIGRNSLQTGLVAFALLITPSVLLAITAWVVPYAAALVVMAVPVARLLKATLAGAQGPTASRPVRLVAREFWSFSAPRALSRVFSVALQRLDILLVSAIRGLEEAAVYAAASRFVLLGLMFVQAIQQVMAPRISEFLAREDITRARTIYQTTTAWLMLISWPIYLVSATFAPFLLTIFGPGYSSGAPAVVILCLVMLVATACGPVDIILLMGGRSVWSLLNTALALAVTVCVDLLLLPTYGIIGAALGWAAGLLVSNLLPLYQVNRFLGMHPFGQASLRAATITLVCFGGMGLLMRLVLGVTLASCLATLALGTLSFLGCLRWQRTVLDIDALLSVYRRRRP